MKTHTIALFGEAEKGEFKTPYVCQTLVQLMDRVGLPPKHSLGIHYAVQALLFRCTLFFFRVHEEGFNPEDYLSGLHVLQKQEEIPPIMALCLPGVGDSEIIKATAPVCAIHHSLLIVTEADLYDYLTGRDAA